MAMAGRQKFAVVVRRVLYGQRGYSTQPAAGPSLWVRLDTSIERALPEKVKPLWNHPAGMKTIHFWAPSFKWCLVIAGIADYARPPENLSVRQSGALCATGAIWSRYSMVIVPKNWNLFSVNFFLCLTGGFQLLRIYLHQKKLKAENPEEYQRLYGRGPPGPVGPDGSPCPVGEGRRGLHTGEGVEGAAQGDHRQFRGGPPFTRGGGPRGSRPGEGPPPEFFGKGPLGPEGSPKGRTEENSEVPKESSS